MGVVMLGADYPAGTVATATLGGLEGVRVMRTGTPSNMGWEISYPDMRQWISDEAGQVRDVRPLIVLDLPDYFYETAVPEMRERSKYGATSLRLHRLLCVVADQIDEQTHRASDEPTGLGAVVQDIRGGLWIRINPEGIGPAWRRTRSATTAEWREIGLGATVLSEGVAP